MLDQYWEMFGLQGGVLLIVGVGLVIFLLVAIILERRTRIIFPERGESDDHGFFSFDYDEEDDKDE